MSHATTDKHLAYTSVLVNSQSVQSAIKNFRLADCFCQKPVHLKQILAK